MASTGARRHRLTAPAEAARWSAAAGIILGLAGVADLVRWGNRWYVTEVFARDAGTPEGASWEWVYGMLHSAHEALVRGVVLSLLAAVLVVIAVGLRRRAAR